MNLVAPASVEGVPLLAGLVLALLFGPKLLVALCAGRRARGFGGRLHLFASVGADLLQSCLVAPVLLMFQARSVVQVLLGRDGGWPPQVRGDDALGWGDGWRSAWWIPLWGLGLLAAAMVLAPPLLPWLLPLAGPMILAPVLVTWTSRPARSQLFVTSEELKMPQVSRRTAAIEARWSSAVLLQQSRHA